MAEDNQPIELDNVRDEEHFFGGDIVWWLLLLLVSVPIMLLGLSQAPQIFGFFMLSLGGILAGIAFAQVTLRLPYLTNRFVGSLLIVIFVSAIIGGIATVYVTTLPVTQARQDTMFKPPISGG